MSPNSPTIPSQGLTRTAGSVTSGRTPGRSSRVKQSCRLEKLLFFASCRRKSSANSRQVARDNWLTNGFSILLNHPMKRLRLRRGMRLHSRKLSFSGHDSRDVALAIFTGQLQSGCWSPKPAQQGSGQHIGRIMQPQDYTGGRHADAERQHDQRNAREIVLQHSEEQDCLQRVA